MSLWVHCSRGILLACSFVANFHFQLLVKGCPIDPCTGKLKLLFIPFLINKFVGKHFAIIKYPVSC